MPQPYEFDLLHADGIRHADLDTGVKVLNELIYGITNLNRCSPHWKKQQDASGVVVAVTQTPLPVFLPISFQLPLESAMSSACSVAHERVVKLDIDLPPLNSATSREIIWGGDAAPNLVPAELLAMQGR